MDILDIPPLRMGHRAWHLMMQQEQTGIHFDIAAAKALHETIASEIETIRAEVEPQLPPRALLQGEKAYYTFPAKCVNKDGSASRTLVKFADRHGATIDAEAGTFLWQGGSYPVRAKTMLPVTKPMELGNQEHLKDWLQSRGWTPTFWNVKKGSDGKPVRDDRGKLITTSPKLQDKGTICPSLERMEGDMAQSIVKWLSLRNRAAVLAGWLANPRLDRDSRLPAGASGITPTHRIKHRVVTNLPKADGRVSYGVEIRSLFCAPPGRVLVGYDASSLEDRIKAHYTYRFDNGAYAEKILDPNYDAHQENADLWGITRQQAKSGTYALAYNAQPATLAKTIGCAVAKAKLYHELYWRQNDALKQLIETLEAWWETKGGRKFIKRPDGLCVMTRAKHSLGNALIQSTASMIMDYGICWMDARLGGARLTRDGRWEYRVGKYTASRVAYVHDELVYEVDEEIAEHIKELGMESIAAAGRYFEFRVPLLSSGKVGPNWAAVH